jgi:hypothetical protein
MTWKVVIQTMPGNLHSFRNESECTVLNPGSVLRGSDELRGENVPDGLGALLVLGGFLYMARAAIWRVPPGRFATLWSRHGQRAILRARNELAGHSPYGNRCNSVGVGGQFLASATDAYAGNEQRRAAASKSNR